VTINSTKEKTVFILEIERNKVPSRHASVSPRNKLEKLLTEEDGFKTKIPPQNTKSTETTSSNKNKLLKRRHSDCFVSGGLSKLELKTQELDVKPKIPIASRSKIIKRSMSSTRTNFKESINNKTRLGKTLKFSLIYKTKISLPQEVHSTGLPIQMLAQLIPGRQLMRIRLKTEKN